MSLTVLACFALIDSAMSAKTRLSQRLASQPNSNQLPPNPCSCLWATYIMPDFLILLCLYFWNDVQLENDWCGSSVKCQRERLAHPRHPGASETKVLSQPPCLSTPLQQPQANYCRSEKGSLVIQAVWLVSSSLSPSPGRRSATEFTQCNARNFIHMMAVIDAYSLIGVCLNEVA